MTHCFRFPRDKSSFWEFTALRKNQGQDNIFDSHRGMVQVRLWANRQKAMDARMEWMEQLLSVNWFQSAGCALGAYFLGCFTAGYYLVRARTGKDIREIKSGSVGARNVGRVLGKSGFAMTLLCDSGKGAVAVWLAQEWTNNGHIALLAMLAVVFGHIWPIQLRFCGGKGVATSFGALLVFDYRVALTILVLFLGGLAVTRKSLFPAMFAFACLPLVGWFFEHSGFTVALLAVLSATILFAHRRNLVDEFVALGARHAPAPEVEQPKL
jgi:glycerol-3-phosphate acyltransferase PlsY